MQEGLTVRIAQEADSEPFAQWIGDSTDIPVEDVRASLKDANPTSVTLVIENEGKIILFAPTYAIAILGFIGFNPEATARERVKALDAIKRHAQSFWSNYGVTTIATLTREDYPIAEWALRHGFKLDPRQMLLLASNRDEGRPS